MVTAYFVNHTQLKDSENNKQLPRQHVVRYCSIGCGNQGSRIVVALPYCHHEIPTKCHNTMQPWMKFTQLEVNKAHVTQNRRWNQK